MSQSHTTVMQRLVATGRAFRVAAAVASLAVVCCASQVRAEEASLLRVCADPDNTPFSSSDGGGFENKLATLIADRLDRKLVYIWFPENTGYIPNTFGQNACDLVMGYAQGTGLIEDTNPYYYTSYVLITRTEDADLKDVAALSDPRLKSKRIGFLAHTPPASILTVRGLAENAKPFDARSGESQASVAQDMIKQIVSGELDAGLLWGPVGGYYAALSDTPLTVVPLVKERAGPATIYGITLGVRPNEPQFKHQVNKVLAENADEITSILKDFHVPVLDQEGQVVAAKGSTAAAGQ
ncbi:MAG: quinoprotein dehydrogenase-associated putative ABC transporter substrate-binding protein [Methyloceanibacter sp.]|nr:quinoprotein dehydrogenase-associated putative ABC transporter substrate-binding protein [Methyloceanibacter sp.]